jgi:putative membrane protein
MNALQIFALGVRERVSSLPRILALVCIVVIPIMYPLFWLQAFWNPYANIGDLPIAFVNDDAGAYGVALQAELEGDDTMDWYFVDRETADSGLRDKTFYAAYVVPSDFSERIGVAQTANIETYVDGKNNYMSTLLANQIGARLESSLSQQIAFSVADKMLPSESVAQFVANPVENTVTDVNPLPNSGTGFAPYFSSLALWIGALLITMMSRKPIGGERWQGFKGAHAVVGRLLLYAAIGVAQSAMLVAVYAFLGITMSSVLLTFLALVVCSLCCIALVSTFISLFGRFGQMLSMLILLFQLTSSGGTYPIELAQSGLFQALHPFVPFTYSVNALRETISGVPIDGYVIADALLVQVAVVAIAVLVCSIVETVKRYKRFSTIMKPGMPMATR